MPDWRLQDWHPTNPKAYKKLFDERAVLMMPRLTQKMVAMRCDRASVEPFPAYHPDKGVLRRVVQLLKRHRDIFFADNTDEIAPIAVVITTLAMQSYDYCVERHVFQDALDILIETIRTMPRFIGHPILDGRTGYAVWNENASGENFAEGWNKDERKPKVFKRWHAVVLADFKTLRDAIGHDVLAATMKRSFGDSAAKPVFEKHLENLGGARKSGHLLVAPGLGLTTSKAAAAPMSVPSNTFFGDRLFTGAANRR